LPAGKVHGRAVASRLSEISSGRNRPDGERATPRVYRDAPESHITCDDFYSIRLGSARFAVDGYIVGAKEQPAGEIHGIHGTAIGAREYTAGVGDLVSIPRNTMHYMAPEAPRFAYLLVKVCD
jgi:hypothetical protein